MDYEKKLEELKLAGEAPEWLTVSGFTTLSSGYLLKNETPCQMYRRVANASAKRLNKPELADKFYQIIFNNWLCLATPVASNMGAEKNLPISCYSNHFEDSTYSIFQSYAEMSSLAKYGGGVGCYFGDIRPGGSPISSGGITQSVISWIINLNCFISSVAQGQSRRGACCAYLDIEHLDCDPDFLDLRKPTGDVQNRALSAGFHHGVCISDKFMNDMLNGDEKKRETFTRLLKNRVETGEPFIIYKDNVNNNLAEGYKENNLKVSTSNLCTEIFLHTDKDHTFVCCLSSLNLARYDEWKNTDTVELATWFLDGVMTEFIDKAKKLPGLEKAVRFAEKSRALGLGVLGFATLLQMKMIPFDSFEAMRLNAEIFKLIKEKALKASQDMAKEYGAPLWCQKNKIPVRNLNLLAVAPTVSNSEISGSVSQGIEPITANYFAQKTAKGTFIKKNQQLQKILQEKGRDTFEVWESINKESGSVQHLDFLSEKEKEVFLTAREINQMAIIRLASARNRYVDQGQSLNLFFAMPKDSNDEEEKKRIGKYIFDCHIEAWKMGVKSLYYLRSESPLKGGQVFREGECKACEA